MPKSKPLQGILVLIDIVNFTKQAQDLGDNNTAQYSQYFQEEIKRITEKNGFRVIKFLGDAALIFGKDPEKLLEIMLDMFDRDKPEDKFGFLSRFRIVGHSGFFQFKMKNRQPTDLVSAEGIKVFRMEKYAGAGELMVNRDLYQGVKSLLTTRNIEANRMKLEQPFKGFDSEKWFPPFYKLKIARKELGAANLLEQRMDELEKNVQFIHVFGNMYPEVPIDKNFINISIHCDWGKGPDSAYEEFIKDDNVPEQLIPIIGKGKRRRDEDDWIFIDKMEQRIRPAIKEIDVNTLYQNKGKKYNNGVIFGLPGAGKTTILRYLAYKELKANKRRKPGREKIIMFIPCRNIPFYDTWHKNQYGSEWVEPDENTALEYMTWVFFFGDRTDDVVMSEEREEFRNAVIKVIQAFKDNRLTLLVDALDEAPGSRKKERIVELLRLLTSKNRVFLTARPSERNHLRHEKLPVFNVLSLNMEQVREVARNLMKPDSFIYKRFDDAIWQEEIVIKMAATPLMALLMTAYFQAYGQFDNRFTMYDLLMKFILVKVWENIKTDTFQYKSMEFFFEEIKKNFFLKKYKYAWIMYEGLGSLCFQLFFQGSEGKIHRLVSEKTLQRHFKNVISQNISCNQEQMASYVGQWIEQFQQDHLLLQAGAREYVFIHPTMMEYLAAFHMIRQGQQDINKLPGLVDAALKKEDYLPLETLPIATTGNELLDGFKLLAQIRDTDVEYDRDLLRKMGIRCLAELEWQITKNFQVIRIEGLIKKDQDIISQNQDTVDWVYNFFKDMVLSTDKDHIRENLECLNAAIKFSRDTLFNHYLDYKAFEKGDSQLVALREQLLYQMVQKELVDRWLKSHREKQTRKPPKGKKRERPHPVEKRGDLSLLSLDTPGYHPDDKNFAYHREYIRIQSKDSQITGEELKGFLGSPNLKHSGGVLGCAFSPDGKTILSGSFDKTLKLWDVDSGKEICFFTGHQGSVNGCAFSPDGKTIVSCSNDESLKLWDVKSGKEIRTFAGHESFVTSCAFSPNGKTILSVFFNRMLKLWDTASGKEIRTFTGHQGVTWTCAFSPHGKTILSGSSMGTLKLWNRETGKEIRVFTGHKGPVTGCDLSPDRKTIISASNDGTLKLWDLESGKEIRAFTGHKGIIRACAFSADGNTIVSASEDSTLKLWKRESGEDFLTLNGHKGDVNTCAFAPDGKTLLSGSSDFTLKLWNTLTGGEIRTFTGHNGYIRDCAFSPDGKTLISVSDDHTLRFWDAGDGKLIKILELPWIPHSVAVSAAAPGLVITANLNGTLTLFEFREIGGFQGIESGNQLK